MYYKIAILALLICPKLLSGQINLVPNPSFEEYDTCPNGFSSIWYANNWFQPNNYWGSVSNSGSSDLWNSCFNDSLAGYGVPNNYFGYQYPRTGNGYAGVGVFNNLDSLTGREYIEVMLNSPLINNHKYCVSFYVSLANGVKLGISGIGAFFSTDSLLENSMDLVGIIRQPQIFSSLDFALMDTTNWMEIRGEFIAHGSEKFMTIGNFFDGDSIKYMINDSNAYPPNWGYAYYYIDDVSVYACDTGISINEQSLSISKLYTTQNGEWVFENPSNKGISLEVFNSLGQVVFKKVIYEEKVVFYPNLKSGIYYWQANGQRGKVVVE